MFIQSIWLLSLLELIIAGERDRQERFLSDCMDVKLITYATSNSVMLNGLPFTGPAIDLALREVNGEYGFNLTNVVITKPDLMSCMDLAANIYLVPEYVYGHLQGQCFILLNPGCDDELPLGQLSAEWNIPILTSCATYPQFYNPTAFPTMVSFGGADMKQLEQAVLDVLQYFHWSSVAIVHDTSPTASSVYPALAKVFKNNLSPFFQFTLFPVNTGLINGAAPYRSVMDGIRPVSRVIVLLIIADQARQFMFRFEDLDLSVKQDFEGVADCFQIATQMLGKTAEEFVFICADPFQSIRRSGDLKWNLGDEHDQVAKIAFRKLLHLTSACDVSGNNSEQHALDTIKSDGIKQYQAPYMESEDPSEISMSAYYSVKALGVVLNEAFDAHSTLRDGRVFAQQFRNTTFVFNRRRVFIDKNRIRLQDYCLRDMDFDLNKLVPVMRYDTINRMLSQVSGRVIDWGTPGNVPLPNEPKCGFMGDRPSCQESSSFIASVTVPVAIVTCLTVGAVLWFIIRTVSKHQWMLEEDHLKPYAPRAGTRSRSRGTS